MKPNPSYNVQKENVPQVIDFERDINLVKSGEAGRDDLVYKTLVGLNDELRPAKGPAILGELLSSDEESELDEGGGDDTGLESDDEDSESRTKFIHSARPKEETPESKKVMIIYTYQLTW